MRTLIAGWLIALASLIAGPALGVALPQGTAVFETSLQSRISSTDTSMTLVTATSHGETISGYNCFTIDEGRTDAEFVCGTVSGTTISSLERGISFANGTTTSASRAFVHRVGANVKETDFPLIQRLRNQANGTETYPNPLYYNYNLSSAAWAAAASNTVATYGIVAATASAGAADSSATIKGIVEKATAVEAATGAADGSGNTSAPLVLTASLGTSTPYAGLAGSKIPITDSNGFLSTQFFGSTTAYRYGFTFASSTYFGVTTLNLNGWPIVFNGSNTGSSTVLGCDGSGNCSLNKPDMYSIAVSGVAVTTSNTSTTTLKTVVIPAGTLGPNDQIEIEAIAGETNMVRTNDPSFSIKFGNGVSTSTIINDALVNTDTAKTIPVSGMFKILLSNQNSLSSQVAVGYQVQLVPSYATTQTFASTTLSTYNTANAVYFDFAGRCLNGSDTCGYRSISVIVKRGK